ncbi:hypothetical protein [Pedobacter ginsengisoli]|uniref:hypothetical protein n=1 Tax=Pedobacter ginsengisoli TaxID=363852 RepID=UPI002550F282|nr:hypothetical protein [Pedobacter ginsengisoli]
MYKAALICLCAVLFIACDKKDASECPDLICTESFAMVTFSFTNKDGVGVGIKNYSAVNQRTGDTIKTAGIASLSLTPGTYVVVDDNYVKKLSEEGDDIKVSGTLEATNQTKTAILKVSGGKCACHIEKISGPEKVAFD